MGVIRNMNQLNRSALDEADWIYLSSDGEEAAAPNAVNIVPPARTRRNQRQPKKTVTMPEPVFKALGAKGKSHKKFRRYANANLAMTELGSLVDEADLEAVSINDFIQPSASPFAMLLQKLDLNILELNEFINCTEEEQRDLIGEQDIELEHCSHSEHPPSKGPSEYEERDSRRCFSRIDPNIRQQLVKRHVPLGLLSSIEGQIVEFFKDNPRALYEAHFKCSFKRFLLHACCQYLNLNCQSVDSDGVRLSLVKNKAKHFAQPQKLLSEYLEVIL